MADIEKVSEARIREFVKDAVTAEIGWRRHFTLALSIGNGAGLLAYFNAAATSDFTPPDGLVWSAVAFLFGLVAATAVTRVWAMERAMIAKLGHEAAAWTEAGGHDAQAAAAVVKMLRKAQGLQNAVGATELVAAAGFLGGVVWALILLA